MPEPEYDLPLNVKGETAIYVLARISGEGNDREAREGDIFLTESERRTILELKRQYRRFMLVLNVGGPVDLSPVMEVENILILSQLGVQTGSALADLVLGKTVPLYPHCQNIGIPHKFLPDTGYHPVLQMTQNPDNPSILSR